MTSVQINAPGRGLDVILALAGDSRPAPVGSNPALGDSRPAAEDLIPAAGGSTPAPGRLLMPDVQAWLASPEQGLTATIEAVSGAEATVEALARLRPSRLEVVGGAASGDACWAEIARRGAGPAETCVVGLTYGAGDQISRIVWLRAPLLPALPVASPDPAARALPVASPDPTAPALAPPYPAAQALASPYPAPDGRPILESYFAHLMSSRFREAAAHFAADALYSHPPYAGGTEWVLFHGRDALWRGFEVKRGPSPARQIITGLWQERDRVFIEGVIEGIPDGGTFFATAQITLAGEIARYVAFYSATRIPR